MSDHHHHHHDHSGPIAIGATAARVVVGLLTGIGVLVLIGTVWLWPSNQHVDIPLPMQNGGGGAVHTEAGTVTSQDLGPCGSLSNGRVFDDTPNAPRNTGYNCQRSLVAITSGPDEGKHTLFEIAPGPGQPDLRVGDDLRIVRQNDPGGTTIYSFDDYARGLPLTVIALVFVVVIVAVARWRGLRAVLGLGFAFGVLVVFLLPAMLDGKPAVPVALVSGALILYAVLYLAHGVNLRTSSALLGTLSAMVLAAVLSWVTLEVTHLTGLSEEQNANVATYLQHVSITGLLLAGFIIGSLGVLNDVTITQASAAFELAALDEQASRREIFAAAMRVGRDHIASTVYTLVLAYAGGALPLLLLFSVAGRSFRDVLTGDAVAIEISRSAVGGICLALSVPLTTVIAVLLARPFGHRPAPAPAARRSRHSKGANPPASQRRSANDTGRPARPAANRPRRRAAPTSAPIKSFDAFEDDATPPEGLPTRPPADGPRRTYPPHTDPPYSPRHSNPNRPRPTDDPDYGHRPGPY
ncbi:putative membrane protein [Nocardia transvalensis]|uniref:Putative membrane protein n=1 Tax=Nocardia transvalensis TaxID=37333 RepID=A0A7W9PDL2_9NOCA|nr:putative membrane protein [Nocardia transvalensis]